MPNAKILEEKKAAVEALSGKIKSAASGVLVKYQGITVEDDTKLRTALRKAGVEYTVIKNSMIHLATEALPYGEQLKSILEGPTAVAFGYEDMIAPAKIASEYGKKTKKLAIKGGACDGAYLDEKGVQALAELPSKEVLIARFMGSLMSSVSAFARVVEARRKQLAGEE